jgi:2'-5' RNA ligase
MIDPKDIYTEEGDRTFGFEDEPHTTLLFGLHEGVTNEQVQSVLDEINFGECNLYNASKFENPKYDVFKFDVVGPGLHTANMGLKKFPHTTGFPKYHPHATIAYLQPGTADKYIQALKDQDFRLIPTHAVYSKPNGELVEMDIKVEVHE